MIYMVVVSISFFFYFFCRCFFYYFFLSFFNLFDEIHVFFRYRYYELVGWRERQLSESLDENNCSFFCFFCIYTNVISIRWTKKNYAKQTRETETTKNRIAFTHFTQSHIALCLIADCGCLVLCRVFFLYSSINMLIIHLNLLFTYLFIIRYLLLMFEFELCKSVCACIYWKWATRTRSCECLMWYLREISHTKWKKRVFIRLLIE